MPRLVQDLIIQVDPATIFSRAGKCLPLLIQWWEQLEQFDLSDEHTAENPRFTYTYALLGVSIKGEGEVQQYEPPRYLLMRTTSGIRALIELAFEGVGNTTHVTVTADYALPGALLGSATHRPALEQQLEADITTALTRFKQHMESLSETET
ncbi:MAG: SRPBCC family protein [Anaerolineae bacterium]|nr:SRPBCC family protein [Anaerolineae bacterium]MCA9908226.1 SRPBCC family protein [Anaerolineae bacterium]